MQANESLHIHFPLSRGNILDITLRRKCTAKEFEVVRKIYELAESAFVDDAEAEANMEPLDTFEMKT